MRAALFDLDGVIIDTEPSYSIFWGSMGDKYNVGVVDFADVIKGTTLTQILDKYFPKSLHDEVVDQLVDYENHMAYKIFPGALNFLQQCVESGIRCAIVTSSNLEKMSHLWAQHPQLRTLFEAVITDEDVSHSKPDPEPYLVAAHRLGVRPEETVVFEDSFNGLLSGRRAGAKVVGLSTTNAAETLIGKADLVIEGFTGQTPDGIAREVARTF